MAHLSLRRSCLALPLVAVAATSAWANPFVVTPSNSAAALVAALVSGAGVNVVAGSETYSGAANASGTFTGGTGIIPFDAGVVLTTGAASFVLGPNNLGSAGTNNGAGGDAGLGPNTFNASILEFDFIPTAATISFQYVFGSEEYNEYVGSQFNDLFSFFLNGSNIAKIPGTAADVAINSVNCNTNSTYYTSNSDSATGSSNGSGNSTPSCGNAGLNTQLDGLVGANALFQLFAVGNVNVGQTNHIKLTIADRSDTQLDSAVFLKGGSFVNAPPPTPNDPGPGPSPVPEPSTMVLLGTGVTALVLRARRSRR